MPSSNWRTYGAAARSGLSIFAVVAFCLATVWWAKTEPAAPLMHSDQPAIHCQYSNDAKPVHSGTVPPRVLVCTQHASDPNEYPADAQLSKGDLKAAVPFTRHLLNRTLDEPVSLFTFVLAVFTLLLWLTSRDQHDRLKETIDHAKTSAERQLRPYMFLDHREFPWRWHAEIPGTPHYLEIILVWKNMGQTPARRVVACLNAEGLSGVLPKNFEFPDISTPRHIGSVGPGATIQIRFTVEISKFSQKPSVQKRVYYWAWIEYDGFENSLRHRTEICAEIYTFDLPADPSARFTDAFEVRFNGADADCYRQPEAAQNT